MSIGVTDHCIVRYFERHFDVDIEKIKNEILPDYIRRELEANPDKQDYVIGSMVFKMKGDGVATCVPLKSPEPEKKLSNKPKQHSSNRDTKGDNWHSRKKYTKRIKKRKGDYKN